MNYPDSHLQSAIRSDERRITFRSTLEKCPAYLKPYILTLPLDRDIVSISSEYQYGIILSQVYNPNARILSWVKQHLPSAFEVSVKLVKQTLTNIIPGLNLPDMQSDDYICRLISVCTLWEDLRSQMQSLLLFECKWIPGSILIEPMKKYYISGKFMIANINNSWYVFSYDQVMMISDTIWARCNVLMYHHILPTGLNSKVQPVYIEQCYSIIDREFIKFGNSIYDGIKNWESIILGSLVEDYDPYDGGVEFITPVLNDMTNIGFHFIPNLYNYVKGLKLLPDQYSELHGLNRHWGHPTVDEPGACKKTRDISQNRPIPVMSTLIDSVGCLKRQYIVSFIQKHGRWPAILEEDKIKNKVLRSMVKTHARHLNLYQSTISLNDWYNLDFGKEMEFDYHPDYTELLDDKAISPLRSEFRSLFNPNILGYKPGKSKGSRRLLRAIMEITSLDIKSIIHKIRLREVPSEWFIVILHSKERELKIKPRLFAMMVLEMRIYFVVTEKNIAVNIFPYFPQQTMTLSEAELSKRIYKFTEQGGPSSCIPFYVMIDFKSWNIHWSEYSTLDVFRFIDDLQGVKGLYTFTHEFFQQCLMVLSSSLLPPNSIIGDKCRSGDPPECETLWYNHLGGWDGLRQKGWTISTIALLLLVEHKTGIQSQIVGQADNQICKILIPRLSDGLTNEEYIKTNLKEIKEKINLFTNTLDEIVSNVGLVLKKEESLVSSVLTIYGKEMTLNGAQLSQASKKFSRALAEVNTTVPSLHSKTLTLHSAGLGTSQKTHTPIIPCILSNVLSMVNFINGSRYSVLTGSKNPKELWDWIEGENAITFLLLGSGDAGGTPIQNILNYLYRGHPDSLTAYTTYLYILSPVNDMAKRIYLYFQNRKYPIGDADPELLVSNPCSTNISSFPLVASRYRRKLEILVQRRTKNRDLQALFPLSSQKDDKETFNFLLKFKPLQPRLLHEIFRLTPTCSRLTFLAKFSNTRTVHAMLKEERQEVDVLDEGWESFDYTTNRNLDIIIDDVDIGMLAHLKNTYNSIRCEVDISTPLICPTQLAKDMRQTSWKDLIGTSTIDGVTIPHPVHQFKLSFPNPGTHDSCNNTIEHCIFSPLTNNPKDVMSTRGPLPPYIGSRTREKVTGKIYSIPTTARPFKAAERAIILGDWCVNPNSSLYSYLISIVESRTDILDTDLRKIAGRISGGTSIHRLDSHMGSTSTLNNSLANLTTHILFSTDTMGRFSQGRENYVIHFQGIIHTGLSLLGIYIAHQNRVPIVAHLHYNGLCCEELLDDSLVSGHADIPNIPKYPDNPLLYTKVDNISSAKLESLKGILIENHKDSSWALAFILLSRIRTRILFSQWGVTETSAPTTSSLGVQEVLRIGIKRIIKSLAKLLYLHLDYEDKGMELLLQSISNDIWSDLSNIILIPDVLIPTITYLDLDGVPDAYINPNHISRCLNRALINEVIKFHHHPNRIKKILPYHLYGNIKIAHILRMWGKVIYIQTNHNIDMRPIIKSILTNPLSMKKTGILTSSLATQMAQLVIKYYGIKGFIQVWKENPLKISYIPPETLLRIDPFPEMHRIETMKLISPLKTLVEDYAFMLVIPPRSDVIQTTSLDYFPTTTIYHQKLRADHMYRTTGQVSTAFMKYMEIILKDELPITGTAVCTADGESSVGFLLYKLTGLPIIYNSLINRQKLQPQRGYTYIPGSFLKYPSAVLNAETNSLLGGDITQVDVQDSIISCAQNKSKTISIITCDAESSIDFSLNITVKILLSICRIGYCVKAESAIIKTYLLDSTIMSLLGGHLQLVWEDVKLVTPCFSSYESSECFWVCKSFNPSTDISNNINYWNTSNRIHIHQSCTQSIIYMADYMKNRKSSVYPLQRDRIDTVNRLTDSARYLGFRSNTIQAFYIVTNNLVHYDNDLTLRMNLEISIEKLLSFMYNYLQGIQRVYEGKPLDSGVGAAMTKGKIIHSTIESFIIAYRNTILTLKLEELKFDLDDADLLIHTSSITITPILDRKKKILYEYKDPDENQWRQRYLKSIWKLIGSLS